MEEKNVYNLKINDEFKILIPPLSSEELKQLEQNIVRDGCREPLCVWNNIVVDGHNRYEICSRLQIPFSIRKISFKDHDQAIAWICANQLGRRNITEETRRYLIGKRYETEKILGVHNAVGINQHTKNEVRYQIKTEPKYSEPLCRTKERLGEEYRVNSNTVLRYGRYAHALDKLSKSAPEFVAKLLNGELKMSQDWVIRLAKLSQKEIIESIDQFTTDNCDFISYSDMRKLFPKPQNLPVKKPLPIPDGSVKNMPVHDPDAEFSSLAFTIPSWVSSINRTRSNTIICKTSENVRDRLKNELLDLKTTIDTILMYIEEEN